MDHFEDFLQENIDFKDNVNPNTFEEFLEPEEHVDHGHLFATDRIFNSKIELVDLAKETAMKVNTFDCHSVFEIKNIQPSTQRYNMSLLKVVGIIQTGPCHPLTLYHQNLSLNKAHMRECHNQWLYNQSCCKMSQPETTDTTCSKKEALNCTSGPLT
ncbi:hypothetical protein M9H77_26506 [Catharanthus roseus]|uniref:Uncharacterized protein n=1 Tax=Catharanthus roseus TaxID=4058 RepID=A0ACC0AE45_CATRO|nr:hypothetical protein M9H77_26506 [Catharanthus roseus]